MAISASDAAFEGFRITRERPLAVAAWTVIYFLFAVISGAVMVALAGESFQQLIGGGEQMDPAEAAGLLGAVAPAVLLLLAISVVFYGVLYAAVTRAVLRPEEARYGYLRLGRAEVNQVLVLVGLSVLLFVLYVVIALALTALAGLIGVANRGLGVLVATLGGLAEFCGFLYVLTRLSLAGPLTFDLGRVQVLQSWRLTKGHFWPMFGAYVLALALALVVMLMITVLMAVVVALVGGGMTAVATLLQPDLSSLGAYFRPMALFSLAVGALTNALTTAITIGAGASLYKQLRPTSVDVTA